MFFHLESSGFAKNDQMETYRHWETSKLRVQPFELGKAMEAMKSDERIVLNEHVNMHDSVIGSITIQGLNRGLSMQRLKVCGRGEVLMEREIK